MNPPHPLRVPNLALLTTLVLAGCSSPLAEHSEETLRRAVLDSVRRQMDEVEPHPEERVAESTVDIERLQIKPEAMRELLEMAGPDSYDPAVVPVTPDLLGQQQGVAAVSLERAVRSAVANNLAVQFAAIEPAISQADVVAAEAAFDWTLFSNANWSDTDTPRTSQNVFGGLTSDQRQTGEWETGIRRPLTTGGQFAVQHSWTYTDVNTPLLTTNPNPAHAVNISLQVDQPLLRNFGSETALAEIRLNRNAERNTIAEYKAELIRTVTETESAYWALVEAHRNLLILQRLVERGEKVRKTIAAREDLDVTAAAYADAVARVEGRRANVLRAEKVLRDASDRLKILMNDPELTIGSEVLIVPVETPVEEAFRFSILDLLVTGLEQRPEIAQSLIALDSASIRQVVADNGRLPKLDLRAQVQLDSLAGDFDGAYDDLGELDYIGYLVGLAFEMPIGNREAEAVLRQRRLQRMQATIAYENTVQQVALEIKSALRNVLTDYRLIGQTRLTRIAQSENLRTLLVRKDTTEGYTIEFLDLEMRRHESLAAAEQDEIAALISYNTSIADLYASIGTSLERNRIKFVVPEASDWIVRDEPEPAGEPAAPGAGGEPTRTDAGAAQPAEAPPAADQPAEADAPPDDGGAPAEEPEDPE